MNATILIPWILAPLVVTGFNYLAMSTELCPPQQEYLFHGRCQSSLAVRWQLTQLWEESYS